MVSSSVGRRVLTHAPWSRATWRETVFVASGVPLQFAGWAVVALPWLIWAASDLAVILLWLAVPLGAAVLLARPLAAAHRERCWAVLGVDIPPLPPRGEGDGLWSALGDLRSPELWRLIRYHLLVGPLIGLAALATVACWLGAFVLTTVSVYAWALPADSPLSLTGHAVRIGVLTVLGVVLLVGTPYLADGVARWDVGAVRSLLGPDVTTELRRRVEDLAEKRAGVVDAADLERRRIERDLHDGVQQRLVSLAMNLGLARETMADLPPDALKVIVEAHEEAKEILTDLRNFIRGLHPAVLEDRGLDAALSGVAARVPVPVRLSVDVPRRASSTVEAVAYFVVSEALTNVVKHASATSVDVAVLRRGDVLHVTVTDDGKGGASFGGGTGLRGLARRVGSVDGTFRITSPEGGPTTITVELPCAL
ncbi:sensor histidine kinase [Actinomadura rupiterrae]|uniref:sensor histidine kinase n=1 Tax=Actinomadura rupiterrae TaxID=559627 RepID=UPI0020A5DD8A|nr:histidine kinase [Actinomadura rupiterrae]MCP2335671.1 signal transduction histidine kinase [Actinomadura rupiterrae]